MKNALRINNLVKNYGKKNIIKKISFQINSGEIVGLLGPNGAGKTSIFYMILGFTNCDSGHITLNEKDITNLPVHVRAKLGISYLPQEPSIFRKLTVKDNLLAILETRQDLSRNEQYKKLNQLLQEFNIEHIQHQIGISLSGGERRRVEIARSLSLEPKFILLDEPFAGVDPISIADIKNIIKHLSINKIGVLITDHNVRDTLDICDCAHIINEGSVIAKGKAKDILNNEQVRAVYLGEKFQI